MQVYSVQLLQLHSHAASLHLDIYCLRKVVFIPILRVSKLRLE